MGRTSYQLCICYVSVAWVFQGDGGEGEGVEAVCDGESDGRIEGFERMITANKVTAGGEDI